MNDARGDRCPHCGGRGADPSGGPCAGCRTEFAAALVRRQARWRALERRLRVALRIELVLGLLFVSEKAWWIAWASAAVADEDAFLSSPMLVFFRYANRALLLAFVVVGIWLDAHTWRLPRAPRAGELARVRWYASALEWTPGATLALACLVNFLQVAVHRGGTAFLSVVCAVALLTVVSAAALAGRARDFDRFRSGCTGEPARVRLGPGGVWGLWVVLAVACWALAAGIRSVGPYDAGFDARTVRAVLVASAIVWFIELGSVRRALRRWSDA